MITVDSEILSQRFFRCRCSRTVIYIRFMTLHTTHNNKTASKTKISFGKIAFITIESIIATKYDDSGKKEHTSRVLKFTGVVYGFGRRKRVLGTGRYFILPTEAGSMRRRLYGENARSRRSYSVSPVPRCAALNFRTRRSRR